MEKTKQPVRYLLYVRKSQDAEDRQMASLDDQEEVMLRLAKERNLKVVDTIKEAKTAKQPGRIGFNELITRISKGEAEGILCWKLNRLARNPVDGGQISWLLQQGTIKHIQTFASDYKPEDNVLMMQVEFGIANQFIKNLSTDVKRGMAQKARRGWSPQRTLPIGYLHNRGYVKGEPEILADPELFPKVSRLWQLMLSGEYSIPKIKQLADSSGIRNKEGKPYHLSTYYSLFNHSFYYGEFDWTDESGKSQTYKGKHPPMISKREFMKVQTILGMRGRPIHALGYEFKYQGLFSCGECGCMVTMEHKIKTTCEGCRRQYSLRRKTDCPDCGMDVSQMKNPTITDRIYYRCTKKKGPCSQKYLEEEKLEFHILNHLKEIDLPEKFVDLFLSFLGQKSQSSTQSMESLLSDLSDAKKALLTKLDTLLDMLIEGDISKSQFSRKKVSLEAEIAQIEHQIEMVETNQSSWVHEVEELMAKVRDVFDSFQKTTNEGKKAIVRAIGSNLRIIDQKPYFSTPEILSILKKMSRDHQAEIARLEPAKTLILQGQNGETSPLIRDMRAAAEFARTQSSIKKPID